MRFMRIVMLSLLALPAVWAHTEATEPAARFETVEVQGLSERHRASGKRLHAALTEFKALRARHGPRAQLFLRVLEKPEAEPAAQAPLRLQLLPQDENLDALDLPAHDGQRFDLSELPEALLQTGELRLNRRPGQAHLVLEVRSPEQPARQVRMGDFRLQCAAVWAMERDQVSLFIRTAFAAAGGACSSRRIAFQLPLPEAASRLELVEGDRRLPLPLHGKRNAVQLPLHDALWSDEARVLWQPV